jgi:hypothetical protein
MINSDQLFGNRKFDTRYSPCSATNLGCWRFSVDLTPLDPDNTIVISLQIARATLELEGTPWLGPMEALQS